MGLGSNGLGHFKLLPVHSLMETETECWSGTVEGGTVGITVVEVMFVDVWSGVKQLQDLQCATGGVLVLSTQASLLKR